MEILRNKLRNSHMSLNEVYFWTATIKDWKHLLKKENYKQFIVQQLQWLKAKDKIKVYSFVLMPNHIHLIWEMLEKNGKEMPHASFNKWTSHQFLLDLKSNYPEKLSLFKEDTRERDHRFWKRDSLAVLMDSREKVEQKLDYIHLNPLQDKWNLAKFPEEYQWSSAQFYATGYDEFNLLTHYRDRF